MDQSKIADLIHQNYSGLISLMSRKAGDRELAADLVNQAIVTSLEHARSGRLSQPEHIAGYVFKVSMNLLRNHVRNMDNRRDLRADPEMLERVAHEPADNAVNGIEEQVRNVIQSLNTERDREIVKRFYLDEDRKEVICSDLGLSPLHFDKVIFRARQRMKNLIESMGFKKSDFFGVLLCFA